MVRTVELPIEAISWAHYPRHECIQQQVDLYRVALESLPPIDVNPNNFGIDGRHRCEAHRQEGREMIRANLIDVADDQVLIESIRRNATHGLQLNRQEKRELAARLFAREEDGQIVQLMELDAIAKLLSVSLSSVEDWTKDWRDRMRTAEDRKIWDLWLACWSYREIAAELGIESPDTIEKRVSVLRKSAEIGHPHPLSVYNIWQFPKCDDRFGIDYPGRIPGQIIEHVLYYYTEPFDIVWDLFGGGGTTIDVARHMARRYQVLDIKPARDGIKKHDATAGLPPIKPTMRPKLIFLDPPYWKQKRGDYGPEASNLANLDADGFHEALAAILKRCIKAAEYTALIISPTQHDWTYRDHAAEMIQRVGVPYHRIVVPYSTEVHGGNYVKMAKENGQWLYLNRDLLIYRGTTISKAEPELEPKRKKSSKRHGAAGAEASSNGTT